MQRLENMVLFISEQTNKVDKKGRVSVPAQFRSALGATLPMGIAAFPSFSLQKQAIDVWPLARLEHLQDSLDKNFDCFTQGQKKLAQLIFADARPLTFDDNGRVLLPHLLLKSAEITGEALFVGQGRTFQIWAPHRYVPHKAEIENSIKDNEKSLSVFPAFEGNSL